MLDSRRSLLRLAFWIFGATTCGSEDTRIECSVSHQRLYGADAGVSSSLLRRAVAGVWIVGESGREELCTATYLSSRYLLTAGHCVGVETQYAFYVGSADRIPRPNPSSEESTCGSKRIPQTEVVAWHRHPVLDLLLIELAEDASLHRVALSKIEPRVEEELLMVGYGLQENIVLGQRETLTGTVTHLERDSFELRAGPNKGACVGDSGGPALRLTPDGDYELLGVLSTGGADCTSYDNYVRLSRARDWLTGFLRTETVAP